MLAILREAAPDASRLFSCLLSRAVVAHSCSFGRPPTGDSWICNLHILYMPPPAMATEKFPTDSPVSPASLPEAASPQAEKC